MHKNDDNRREKKSEILEMKDCCGNFYPFITISSGCSSNSEANARTSRGNVR